MTVETRGAAPAAVHIGADVGNLRGSTVVAIRKVWPTPHILCRRQQHLRLALVPALGLRSGDVAALFVADLPATVRILRVHGCGALVPFVPKEPIDNTCVGIILDCV